MHSQNLGKVKSIQWGIVHEEDGIKEYEKLQGRKVKKCGIIFHHSGILGASPDGILSDGCLLEVKCPYSIKDLNVKEVIENPSSKFYVKCTSNGLILDQKTVLGKNYYNQIQGQLHICNKQYCDLLIWTKSQSIVLKIEKDISWAENINKLIEFYINIYLPKLIENVRSNDI